ncbi:MAG: hypothetical protein ACR2HY_03420 [Acidimicrobiales bacterium]
MGRLTVPGWHAVDGRGHDPATGRPPRPPGAPTPAAALAAVPVATWPLYTVAADGPVVEVADALGPGGSRVVQILARLVEADGLPPGLRGPNAMAGLPLTHLVRATPAGTVALPVVALPVEEAAQAAADVDPAWMGRMEERRLEPRARLRAAGRETELEAALNLAMLLGTDDVDEATGDESSRVASGACLWLLGAAVAWALATAHSGEDPFAAWAELVSHGFWPLGPSGPRLVVCLPGGGSSLDEAASAAISG